MLVLETVSFRLKESSDYAVITATACWVVGPVIGGQAPDCGAGGASSRSPWGLGGASLSPGAGAGASVNLPKRRRSPSQVSGALCSGARPWTGSRLQKCRVRMSGASVPEDSVSQKPEEGDAHTCRGPALGRIVQLASPLFLSRLPPPGQCLGPHSAAQQSTHAKGQLRAF